MTLLSMIESALYHGARIGRGMKKMEGKLRIKQVYLLRLGIVFYKICLKTFFQCECDMTPLRQLGYPLLHPFFSYSYSVSLVPYFYNCYCHHNRFD